MTTLKIQDREVPYKISKSTRAKHISLRISQDGVLSITVPKWVRDHRGLQFAEQKSDWILKHLQKIQVNSPQKIQDGSTLPLFGKDNLALTITTHKKKRTTFSFIHPNTPLTLPQLHIQLSTEQASPKEALQKALNSFYLETARTHLSARTEHFAGLLNLPYNQIRLKDTKSRWGSCSAKKNLNYNYRIILAPKPVIDYLVVHEVCHLMHLDHSQKFWDLVEFLMPDYSIHKKWLCDNGHNLKIPSF